MRPRPGSTARWLVALVAALSTDVDSRLSAARLPEPGTALEVRGSVANSEGAPIGGVEVRLVAEASRLDWHRLTRRTPAPIAVATTTDERGEFRLAWVLVAGYGKFQVEAAQLYRRDRADARHFLATIDITPRLVAGSPVVVAITATDTSFVDDLRQFLASLRSEAERAAYQEFGRPDRIDRMGAESTWWYFHLGTALRWADGRLAETTRFDPVRPF